MNELTSGIYKIENKKTGQIYIGQSKNIEHRFIKHCNMNAVDIDIANEGVENFDFSIIEEIDDNLNEREQYWIEQYNTFLDEKHYNNTKGGAGNIGIYGNSNPNAKYTLWDIQYCAYRKRHMFQNNREPNPCRCFSPRYKGYIFNGIYTEDFLSCEIIGELIDSFIND